MTRKTQVVLAAFSCVLGAALTLLHVLGDRHWRGPRQVMKEWVDEYKGKFDDGWDKYRETRLRPAEAVLGWILSRVPSSLHARAEPTRSWAVNPGGRDGRSSAGLMEVFAGFVEHTDAAGRVEGLEQRGLRENTLIFYIWGDNGSMRRAPIS